jgi:hypothetical protein
MKIKNCFAISRGTIKNPSRSQGNRSAAPELLLLVVARGEGDALLILLEMTRCD